MGGWDDVTADGWEAGSSPGDESTGPTPPSTDAEAGPDDLLTDLFGEEPKPDLPKGADALAEDAPSEDPPSEDAPSEDDPVPPPKQGLRLAERLERQRAASAATESDTARMQEAGRRARAASRHEDAGVLWGHVHRILGYVSQQQDLQQALSDVQITRDPLVHRDQRRRVEELIRPRLVDAAVAIADPAVIELTFDMLVDEWTGISVLGPLWRDDDVTEIMVDAWDRIIIERDGRLEPTPVTFRDEQHAREVARELSQKVSDRAVNESNPIVTAELPGARLHFAVGRVVRTGLSISIRKFRPLMGVEQLLAAGAFDQEIADFLDDAIGRGRANVLVSGGTGSGKTTMLNAMSSFIPTTERVVTLEDAFELTLQAANVVSMQTKEAATSDSQSSVGMAALMRSSLRMRPDRIVVGEIRGPEAQVMLQAANTGHDGTMSTIHASDPTGCLSFRLPDMLLQAREMPQAVARRQVASAVDLVVQIGRRAGRRFVTHVAEVDVSDLTEDGIVPHVLFVGDLGEDGNPTHRRVGSLRRGTELAIKMTDYGADVDRWHAPPGDDAEPEVATTDAACDDEPAPASAEQGTPSAAGPGEHVHVDEPDDEPDGEAAPGEAAPGEAVPDDVPDNSTDDVSARHDTGTGAGSDAGDGPDDSDED